METQVEKYIHNLLDVDLLGYTRNRTHLPEALEFARIEMADRHFTPKHLSDLEQQLQQREKEREEAARVVAAEPLSLEWRIAVFLSGLYSGIPPRQRCRPKIQRYVGLRPDRFLPPAYLNLAACFAMELADSHTLKLRRDMISPSLYRSDW